MSNQYIDVLCDKKPRYGAVESPQEMVTKMVKIIGGGVALVATLTGGIYILGKLGDKHKVDDKLNAYGQDLASNIESFQKGLDKRMSGEM